MSYHEKVSVVIRTYNEQEHLDETINVLRGQAGIKSELQIIVVDSGSTDRTCNIARDCDVELIETAKADFNYSLNLNLGIEASDGDLIVILSAHATPTDKYWLKTIVSYFSDDDVAGVFCRQMPWPNADPSEVIRLQMTFDKNTKIFDNNNISETISFSNAASCIRKRVWKKHNFAIMPAAEDIEWAKRVLANGYKVIYASDAEVFHSHNDSCLNEARRLIEIEKAIDIQSRRTRTTFLTIKQAVGMLMRRSRIICSAEEYAAVRGRQLFRCFIRSILFLVEFIRCS